MLLGITVMAFGVSFSVISDLGTTPISSLPLVTSLISGLSVGTTTVLVNAVLVVLQILLLRRRFQPLQILQLAVAFVFGAMIDASTYVLTSLGVGYSAYWQQWVLTVAGIIGVGIGVALQVTANIMVLPGEGFVMAVTAELQRTFGERPALALSNVKILNDVLMVGLAIVLSLGFLGGLYGVREGTVVAALGVGWVVKATLAVLPGRQS